MVGNGCVGEYVDKRQSDGETDRWSQEWGVHETPWVFREAPTVEVREGFSGESPELSPQCRYLHSRVQRLMR